MSKHKKAAAIDNEQSLTAACNQFCETTEEAAFYMSGVADALEMIDKDRCKSIVHHLRYHASELSDGMMYVKFGYREPITK